jgi:nickel transport protein
VKRLLLVAALVCAPLPALAHKVIAGVFPSGDSIEGEIGLSNGEMAADVEVIVSGPDGTPFGQTRTDADGFFVYKPETAVAHTFYANLGAGHVANVTISAEDVARIMGVAAVEAEAKASVAEGKAPLTSGVMVASLTSEERLAIAEAVRDEIRPLRREIAAYREQNDFQTILGGIGYICGLFGLGFYIAARRKMATS